MKYVAALCLCCSLTGCTSAVHSRSANDGYVPWWVEQGVPNADGTVITK